MQHKPFVYVLDVIFCNMMYFRTKNIINGRRTRWILETRICSLQAALLFVGLHVQRRSHSYRFPSQR